MIVFMFIESAVVVENHRFTTTTKFSLKKGGIQRKQHKSIVNNKLRDSNKHNF